MSAPAADAAAPTGKKKKTLMMVGILVAVLLLGGGGGGWWWMSKQAAAKAAAEAAAEEEEEAEAEGKPAKSAKAAKKGKAKGKDGERAGPPTFVALDPFTINLADRDAERYAQVGITLEVEDAKVGEQLKQFMPAVRNNILLALADKTAAELHARDGKQRLAAEIQTETAKVLGEEQPVRAVHFSNFIIQ